MNSSERRTKAIQRRHQSPFLALLVAVMAAHVSTSVAAQSSETSQTRAPSVLRVALYNVDTTSIDPVEGQLFKESLAVEFGKLAGADIITDDEIRLMLQVETEKQLAGCDAKESCLAEIADALGAEWLVTGSVAHVGEESVIALTAIDQTAAKVQERFQLRVDRAGGEELLASVGPAVKALFPTRPLRKGQTRGVDPSVAARLNPPPLPAWTFWSALGVSSAALAGGIALSSAALVPYFIGNASLQGDAKVVNGATLADLYGLSNIAFITGQVVGGIGVVGLAGTGVAGLFTDFAGINVDTIGDGE